MTGENEPKTIVIIDNNPYCLFYLEEILRDTGAKTVSFNDGRDALRYVLKNEPNLIITEIILPSVNGLSIIRILKTCCPNLPIIVQTGAIGNFRVKYDSLKAGCREFIAKPLPENFLDIVNQYIGGCI